MPIKTATPKKPAKNAAEKKQLTAKQFIEQVKKTSIGC